ncbi:DUF692 domain-containing protein [Glaciecola petra]|uniref:DUF692 domain-containing protein n=1 Tax=Glaciecola petra TaxID=3075602 RepID=A0ABU2ZLR3_9ALTE|nr:DUF692 domain-containing protein [Aestuariibacter sp. P117]MDT0593568.1 DUF692 domain-containing protein [Aestuariibacter sp. P117]
MPSTHLQPEPIIGVGLRHPHYNHALSTELNHQSVEHTIDFVEIHAENFFANGGISIDLLRDASEKYKVSVHGTSLGLGSNLSVPKETLEQFAKVVNTADAYLVSEHLCFNRAQVGGRILHSGDLLPLAYNDKSLQVLSDNVQHVQSIIKRPILIENLSAYLQPRYVDELATDTMTEAAFLIELCKRAGCGLLLDLNNLIVNALNKKETNIIDKIFEQIQSIPAELIGEIHLAGFSDKRVNGFIVDDHACSVSQTCWSLYQRVISHVGLKPTLVEWDNDLPSWDVLLAEANKARAINTELMTQ